MKQAARELDALPLAERDFTTVRVWFDRLAGERLPDVAPDDLRNAWAGLIARARAHRHHLVTREQLSVRSEMSRLLKLLEPARFVEFTSLFAEHADVAPEDLRTAWTALVARARANRHHLVTREQLSVRSEMSRLLKVLEPARYVEFTALFAEHADVAHLVVTFLALLELTRERLVSVTQSEGYAPIYAQLRSEAPFALAPDVESE